MDNFLKRTALVYVGMTVSLLGISAFMEANGAAAAWNPAWPIVHTLTCVFFYPMLVALTVGLAGLAVFVACSIWSWLSDWREIRRVQFRAEEENKRRQAEEKQRQTLPKVHELNEMLDQHGAERMAVADQTPPAKQAEKVKEKTSERKRQRTTEESIKAALDEF